MSNQIKYDELMRKIKDGKIILNSWSYDFDFEVPLANITINGFHFIVEVYGSPANVIKTLKGESATMR